MQVELKDILTWGAVIIGFIAQWFHLKGRVAILETKQEMQAEAHKETLDRIDRKLDRIEEKVEAKADK